MLLPLAWLLACDGGGDGDPTDAPTDSPPRDTAPTGTPDCAASLTDALGAEPSFDPPDGEIVVHAGGYWASLYGWVAEGPPPAFHHETDRSGACRLLRYEASTCAPACALPDVCVDGACVSFPARRDGGLLSVTTDAFTVDDLAQDDTLAWYTSLPGPFEGGIEVAATGGAAAFSLASCAVVAPAPIGDWSAALAARAPGEDVTLAWSPVDPSARVWMRMTTGLGTHGGVAHAEVECEGPDVGSLTLPGAFLDELYREGWSCGECGNNQLFRYRAGQASVDGLDVRLTVRSPADFWFRP